MKSRRLSWLSAPYVLWMALFVVIPLIVVVVYAFTKELAGGAWVPTLENFAGMAGYAAVFARSFLLAAIATVICILIGYPAAYLLTRTPPGFRRVANMLIMLPMWMNFLLRTYSWMFLLERNGFINNILGSLGFFNLLNGDTEVHWGPGTVRRADGTEATLTAKEYALLKKLAANRGNIVTIDALCEALWEGPMVGYENTLMVHIRRLREKIEADPSHPKYLLTVRGLGYRLAREERP